MRRLPAVCLRLRRLVGRKDRPLVLTPLAWRSSGRRRGGATGEILCHVVSLGIAHGRNAHITIPMVAALMTIRPNDIGGRSLLCATGASDGVKVPML